EAVETLAAAALGGGALTHAWLITGPPGSGRSNLAFAFAAALLSPDGRGEDEATLNQVRARTHPDLDVLTTTGVIIRRDDVREMVQRSHYAPSTGPYRVIVVEDADRMTERTSNFLLKELEEPAERTIWVLCAPSEADMLPTIRSRVRVVRLRTPSVEAVARLLVERDGVEQGAALRAARQAQSHIGMAHRLATDPPASERRQRTVEAVLAVHTAPDAVAAAAELLEIAKEDADAVTAQLDTEEREHALRALGVEPGARIPPALRGQVRRLEEAQKRRATRGLRDGLDRILVDLLSVFRDVGALQLGAGVPLVNAEAEEALRAWAVRARPQGVLAVLDAVAQARGRLAGNVAPALAVEALLVTVAAAAGGHIPWPSGLAGAAR
ncbi:MAG TPA: DNA polymerase III subunit delta', partial [Microbacteriaceae bacterium]|nr:DNA polymerase III subunit delta' [Microbacteriaceae bacterium]